MLAFFYGCPIVYSRSWQLQRTVRQIKHVYDRNVSQSVMEFVGTIPTAELLITNLYVPVFPVIWVRFLTNLT